jgi:hypothetical protein
MEDFPRYDRRIAEGWTTWRNNLGLYTGMLRTKQPGGANHWCLFKLPVLKRGGIPSAGRAMYAGSVLSAPLQGGCGIFVQNGFV